jgi:hypothetical protein
MEYKNPNLTNCKHGRPLSVALKTSASIDSLNIGGFQRKEPSGGSANGKPRMQKK